MEDSAWFALSLKREPGCYCWLVASYSLTGHWPVVPKCGILSGYGWYIGTDAYVTLYRYHGVPFPINVGLAPIEAVGMMPSVISCEVIAVGAVGVKIAETANVNLFTKIDFADPLVAVLLILGWV